MFLFTGPQFYYPNTFKEKSYGDCSRTTFRKFYELYGNEPKKIKEEIIKYCGKHPKGDRFLDYFINEEIEWEIQYDIRDKKNKLLRDKIDEDLKNK